MRTVAAAVIVASIASPAASQNVAGLGAVLCREVLPHMDSKPFQSQLFAWATGFLTGINMNNQANGQGYRDFSTMKMDIILGEVRAACARNPDLPVISAIEPMYQQFPARK
ncbi:hypothetical protein [Sinorhizobium meliloti]|uniref:hypothetical protein n=1 Tax=Rhizobium meliloti TaxID=382 RepID=UPI000FDCC8F0|nr:hypothetical protein [Sinorhizobium meliloti]RVO68336.1 hypothetical protein CN087_12725 [Sinorhizobium meliloti]